MKLILTRDIFGEHFTLGRLDIFYDGMVYAGGGWTKADGSVERGPLPFGFTCEDRDRGLEQSMNLADIERLKVRKQTCIPVGVYSVSRTYSPAMGHRTDDGRMILLHDVPGFRGIRCHPGNSSVDTEGCILPGLARDVDEGEVSKSTPAWKWLDARVRECDTRGETVLIEIRREGSLFPG